MKIKLGKILLQKIIPISLTAALLLSSAVFLLSADKAEGYYKQYILYTWNVTEGPSGESVAETQARPLFVINLYSQRTSDGYGRAIMYLPQVYGLYEYDEDGEIILDADGMPVPNKKAGQIVYDEDGNVPMAIVPLLVIEDDYDHVTMFSYEFSLAEGEEQPTAEVTFYINFFKYKNYLIPDLNNEGLHLSISEGIDGAIAENIYPQYFMAKQIPPDKNLSYLRKQLGLYGLYSYDYSAEAYAPTKIDGYAQELYIEGGKAYEGAITSNEILKPFGDAYATYEFNKDFLQLRYIANPSLSPTTMLAFQAYFYYPGQPAALRANLLTSTYFVYEGNI
ncbi:MAG: hypothetical protein LBQ40_02620 [Clostridiales bacterium]|jgi:hypothetical protein|nr:hypothetical protein [Clostridiales bacterium]